MYFSLSSADSHIWSERRWLWYHNNYAESDGKASYSVRIAPFPPNYNILAIQGKTNFQGWEKNVPGEKDKINFKSLHEKTYENAFGSTHES